RVLLDRRQPRVLPRHRARGAGPSGDHDANRGQRRCDDHWLRLWQQAWLRATSRLPRLPEDLEPPMTKYHLAEIKSGRLRAPVSDSMIADFVANLDRVNALADG